MEARPRFSGFALLPLLVALTQTGLGVLVMAGAWTRRLALLASLLLATTVVLSAFHGWFWMQHGMEYPLLQAPVLFVLSLTGAGALSVDHCLGTRLGKLEEGR